MRLLRGQENVQAQVLRVAELTTQVGGDALLERALVVRGRHVPSVRQLYGLPIRDFRTGLLLVVPPGRRPVRTLPDTAAPRFVVSRKAAIPFHPRTSPRM